LVAEQESKIAEGKARYEMTPRFANKKSVTEHFDETESFIKVGDNSFANEDDDKRDEFSVSLADDDDDDDGTSGDEVSFASSSVATDDQSFQTTTSSTVCY
jgi:hypothetical protein